jgi:uncharacterized protein with FMN-binding domain
MRPIGRVVLVLAAALVGLVAAFSFQTGTPQLALTTAGQPASQRKQQQKARATSTSPGGADNSVVLISHSALGAREQYGYGALSVSVTVRGNRIEDVTVHGLQTAEQYSQQLAAQVIPILHSEVLSAQSARINGVSGASYTSQAYALSVQSALDKLHL